MKKYKEDNGFYPTDLESNRLQLPNDGIIGISGFKYNGSPQNFEISFPLPVLLFFNFEIVSYNAANQYKPQGKLKTLYKTKYPNWNYEIYD